MPTPAMSDDKSKALAAALSQIEKQFGKGSVMRLGDQGVARDIQAVSTGSLGLDIALGVGGLPRGRVIEIYGPESSGKTTLTLQVIAEMQKIGGMSGVMGLLPGVGKVKKQIEQLMRERRKLADNEDNNFTVFDTRQIADTLTGTIKVMTTLLGAVANALALQLPGATPFLVGNMAAVAIAMRFGTKGLPPCASFSGSASTARCV